MSKIVSLAEHAEESGSQGIRRKLYNARGTISILERRIGGLERAMTALAVERNAVYAALMELQNGPLVIPMDVLGRATKRAHQLRNRQVEQDGQKVWILYLAEDGPALPGVAAQAQHLADILPGSSDPAVETATSEGTAPDQPPREADPDENTSS